MSDPGRELAGKTALITGGARGFGRACALVLAREGADVAVSDVLDAGPTASEIEALGCRSLAIHADVTNPDDCRRTAEETIERLGKIDILVANAGITGPGGRAWELSVESWERMIAIDLTGVWLTTKYVVPHMIERGYGKIVMTASRSGVRAEEGCAHYVAAKFGVVGYMKALAMELGPWEINVNAICPSGMGKISDEDYDPSQWGPPLIDEAPPTAVEFDREYGKLNLLKSVGRAEFEEVAEGVLWLVSDRSRLMTGCAFLMDSGYVAQRGG
jgi:NAD(P)-dependent dehydrogenase (short-subunit alcohol dehydrogenase family)